MFSGVQEILLLIVIALAIFALPRLLPRKANDRTGRTDSGGFTARLTAWTRLGILASFGWVLLATGYFKPWAGGWLLFVYIGVFPVLVAWGFRWVIAGFKKPGK
jgi:hypothetical protein